MKKFNKIIILGAGFSKAFSKDIPQLKDLEKQIFNVPNRQNYPELASYIEKWLEINDEKIRTIENLTTTIFSKQVFTDLKDEIQYTKLRFQIMQFIYDKINDSEKQSEKDPEKDSGIDPDAKPIFNDFLRACFLNHYEGFDKRQATLIISFNYDLLFEKFYNSSTSDITHAVQNDIYFNYGIPLVQFYSEKNYNLYQQRTEGFNPIYLLKLHGSFNWFKAHGALNHDINSTFYVDLIDEDAMRVFKDEVPVFIPMAHAKELFLKGTLYSTLWTQAAIYLNELEDGDEIYFIGYSFPETDINNLLFFYQFKKFIKAIVVKYNKKDPKDQRALDRLKRIFGDNVVKNVDAKKFINKNLEDLAGGKHFERSELIKKS